MRDVAVVSSTVTRVADAVDGEAEDVEAGADVADRAGREGGRPSSCAPRRSSASLAPLHHRDGHDVVQHAGRGDGRAGAGAGDDERIRRVALRLDDDRVVGAAQAPERRGRRHRLDADADAALADLARRSAAPCPRASRAPTRSANVVVERARGCRRSAPARRASTSCVKSDSSAMSPSSSAPAERARQDQRLARDVGAGEVVARIGLGVAELPRLAHGVAERACRLRARS